MIVRCIKEDYTKSSSEVVQAILKVGDDHLLPKKGQEYEVIGFAHFKGGKEAYLLDGLDTTNYGSQVCFCKEDFEYVKDSYKPNGICETTGNALHESRLLHRRYSRFF